MLAYTSKQDGGHCEYFEVLAHEINSIIHLIGALSALWVDSQFNNVTLDELLAFSMDTEVGHGESLWSSFGGS